MELIRPEGKVTTPLRVEILKDVDAVVFGETDATIRNREQLLFSLSESEIDPCSNHNYSAEQSESANARLDVHLFTRGDLSLSKPRSFFGLG